MAFPIYGQGTNPNKITLISGTPYSEQYGKNATFDMQNVADAQKLSETAKAGRQQKAQMMGKQVAGTIGNIAGGVTAISKGLFPASYDQAVGMEKPNAMQNMLDFSLTGVGSSFGPVGTAIGFVGDIAKNIATTSNAENQYQLAVRKHGLYQARENQLKNLGTDYTGLAKYGMESSGQPVEMESNELVVIKGDDGNYQPYLSTGSDAPTHEQGGVDVNLPDGAVVFPAEFKDKVQQALSRKDTKAIDMMKEQMMIKSTAAAVQGLPFSNQSQAKYGTMVKPKYNFGGVNYGNPYAEMPSSMQSTNLNLQNAFEVNNQTPMAFPMLDNGIMRFGGKIC